MESNPPQRHWRYAAILAILHVALAFAYASVTPFLTPGRVFSQGGGPNGVETIDIGAPDELQHVVQIGRLASGEAFPTLVPGDPRLDFNYQAHQPPLFYYLGAAWSKVVGAGGFARFAADIQMQEPGATLETLKGKKWEPYGGASAIASEGLRLRALNCLIGGLTVLGVFAIGLWATGKVAVGYGAALFAAMLPMHVALSGAVSSDPLLFCLFTWVVALLVAEAQSGLCWKRGLLIGFLTGLAFLTKTSALALIPILAVALVVARTRIPLKRFAPGLAVALLIGGAWWMRNQSVYGEPFVQATFQRAFEGRSPAASDFIARVGAGGYWTAVFKLAAFSFVGVFSYMDVMLFQTEQPYLFLLGLFAFASLGTVLSWSRERPKISPATWILVATTVVVLALFVQFNRVFFQAQARYVMPAIGPIAVAIGAGLAGWFRKDFKYGFISLFIVLALLNALALTILPPSFENRTAPPQTTEF